MAEPREAVRRWAERGPWVKRGAVAAIVGALLCAIGLVVDARATAAAYLVAYAAATTLAIGALSLVMISQLTAATWFVVLRRPAEMIVGALPVLALLVLPLLVGAGALYPWVSPGAGTELARAVARKSAWLNVPFFVVRAVVYWGCWLAFGELLRRTSHRQDAAADAAKATARLRALSAGGLVVVALTVSFASVDWLMSLTPTWYSTVYGAYVWCGGVVGALALLAVVAAYERRRALEGAVEESHVGALAKLLLTFVLLWVYLGYSQLVVVWSGDIPAEIAWYLPRLHGPGGAIGAVLLAGHFALPFLVLLLGAVRRSARLVAALGLWLLLMHYLDSLWLVAPSLPRAPSWWQDLGAVLLVGGATLACAAWRARGVPALPEGDPRLELSLQYAGQ